MTGHINRRSDGATTGAIKVEELREDAAEELSLLLSRSLAYDECSSSWVRAKVFTGATAQPRYRLGLRENGRLVSVVVGVVQEQHREGQTARTAHIKVLATDPHARRRGYAMRLLNELEARFAADGLPEVTTRGATDYFWGGVDVRYSAALCLFQRRGYERNEDVFNLGVDLDGRDFSTTSDEEALAAEGIVIRRVAPTDRDALDAYMRETWGPGWRHETMRAFDHQPISCHIALQNERIVGFAANDSARPGWFGPTGTSEELRGKGIGGVLLRRCLTDWQRDGRKYGEISWIGPLYFYVTSCDARVSRVLRAMTKRLQPR